MMGKGAIVCVELVYGGVIGRRLNIKQLVNSWALCFQNSHWGLTIESAIIETA